MAYWQRKDNKYVCVYVSRDGDQKPLPRKLTRHLDGEPDHNVQYWVDNYIRQHIGEAPRPLSDTGLTDMVLRFVTHQTEFKDRSPDTVREHRRLLLEYVLPYFLVHEPPLKDPNQWAAISPHLTKHLQAKGLSYHNIRKCLNSLKVFWKWLEEEGVVQAGVNIRIRRPPLKRTKTPLESTLDPVIVRSRMRPESPIALMLALGYFFSLRTFELFGLKPSDFVAGGGALGLECCRIMTAAGLYGRLAVNITRQRRRTGELVEPKADSKGWVACFDEAAARFIVSQLQGLPRDELIFPGGVYPGLRAWRKHYPDSTTLKDLRRASIYWLGHHTAMQPAQLMKHARHTNIQTTLLYMRRPEEFLSQGGDLDLDAS